MPSRMKLLLGAVTIMTAFGSANIVAATASAQPAATPTPQVVVSDWAGGGGVARATCPAGTGLIRGGFFANLHQGFFGQLDDGVEANAPDEINPNTWKAQAKYGDILAYAMCVAGAPVPTVVASDWSANSQVARATCPAGTSLVGGGQDARLQNNAFNTVADDVENNAPNEGNATQWTVQVKFGQARAFALCQAGAPTPTIVASAWSAGGAVAKATCPAGTGLIWGGNDARLATNFTGSIVDAIEMTAPDESTPNTWQVRLHSGQARAFAVCAPGAPTPLVSVSTMGANQEQERATCPAGTGLIGGGYDSELDSTNTYVTISASAPSSSTPNSWSVQAFDGHVAAYTLCAP